MAYNCQSTFFKTRMTTSTIIAAHNMKQFIDIPKINKYKGDKESDRENGIN